MTPILQCSGYHAGAPRALPGRQLAMVGGGHTIQPANHYNKKGRRMERVNGIGGIFFKAQDPQRLAVWYREHLGISSMDGHADFEWREKDRPDQIGRTVWSLFPSNTDYFGPGSQAFMVNYRVTDLDRMIEQLRRGGVIVEKAEDYSYGRFAWIVDPEGNRVELWEPKKE